jgi:F-type H+-transporting ATPase subunit delta
MLDPVTIRYTEAIFNLAKAEGALDAVRADIEKMSAELAAPAVQGFFFDAGVSIDARRLKFEAILEGMHEMTIRFVHLLFDKRREDVLRRLGEAWHQRVLEEENTAEGVVESARPLASGEIAELAVSLGARLGKRVILENRIVPEMIGGVRVIVENRMIDFSLQGRIDGLRKKLLEAPLPSLSET